jgi:hypothetical protein
MYLKATFSELAKKYETIRRTAHLKKSEVDSKKIVSNTNGEREESERRATDTIVDEIVRNCWKGKFKEREEEDVF